MPWLLLILFGGAAYLLAKNASSIAPGTQGGALVPQGETGGDGAGGGGASGAGASQGLAGAEGGADAALAALLGKIAPAPPTTQAPSGEWYVKGSDGITRLTPAGRLGFDQLFQRWVPTSNSLYPRKIEREKAGYEGYETYASEDRRISDYSTALPALLRRTAAAGFNVYMSRRDIDDVKAGSQDVVSIQSVKASDAPRFNGYTDAVQVV